MPLIVTFDLSAIRPLSDRPALTHPKRWRTHPPMRPPQRGVAA
jgi:hypothetical protein